MHRKWNVDDATVVAARVGGFGRTVVTVNGRELPGSISARKKGELRFALADGRQARFSVQPQFASRPELWLRVDDQLMVETGQTVITCDACGTTVKPNERFCGHCGHAMPTAETYMHRRNVKKAAGAITTLAVLFLLSGLVLFFTGQARAQIALGKLQGMAASATYPTLVNGKHYTVAELRGRITWEPRGMLLANLVLAAVMAGLAFWSRRSPLPAVLIAAATYAVVVVTNALAAPQTLAQGLFLKIVVVALLTRGIKAALALRAANA